MPDKAGRTIDTREELIAALNLAAELEHALLVQYLFAALSCRPTPEQSALDANPERAWRAHEIVRQIQRDLYRICREEMAHLGTVCNLLASIAAPPHFERPDMENVRARLFGAAGASSNVPIDFALQRLGPASLLRFQRFEEPAGDENAHFHADRDVVRAAPDHFEYDTVGRLYGVIDEGFTLLGCRPGFKLFIGTGDVQDRWHWDAGLRISPVSDVASARTAINFIVIEGEGSRGAAGRSHYRRLQTMVRGLTFLTRRVALDAHVWPVVDNPATLPARVGAKVNLLAENDGNHLTLEYRCAELFNSAYTCMLQMLAQFYDPAGEPAEARIVLAHSSKQAMSGVLRPIGEVLVQLPAHGYRDQHAGPPFEIYGAVRLPARRNDRWILLLERVTQIASVCRALQHEHEACKRLGYVAENLDYLFANLDRARAHG
jgi:hypothetical protein